MRKFPLFFLLIPVILFAQSAEDIIKKVDENQVFKSVRYTGEMKIVKGSGHRERVKEFIAYGKGKDKAFIEFTNPGDRGTKYLKIGNELWIKGVYAEEPQKISGHLLRESMMGSDFSYEDTMENDKLLDLYDAKLLGKEKVDGTECYKIELNAKAKEINYPKQLIWVDAERYIGLKVQYFALSGKLLKELNASKVEKIGDRFFPTSIKMENKQRKNSYTIFEMKKFELDIILSDSLFSIRQLEK